MNQSTAEARYAAEERVSAILNNHDERTLALLFVMLRNAGWSTDSARMVLRKEGWEL
jgi:hypothetical protein